ncbi:MAG TPA: protein kinase [Oculatellaceae cyanobacterium]
MDDYTLPLSMQSESQQSPAKNLQVGTGQTFANRFQLLEELGSGGMGTVYKAEDILVKRLVAIKILHLHAGGNGNILRRFQREAQTAGNLNHPNIARVLQFDVTADGQPFLVMEYCSGESLADLLKRSGAIDEKLAIDLMLQLSQGLEHAHACGVIHRDLKPSNILLVKTADKLQAKIVDFGIAKMVDDEQQHLTRTGEIFGSPLYMSPEQADGIPVTDQSDQYSLGCLFYECLTGVPPHVGKTSIETLVKHKTAQTQTLKQGSMGKTFSPSTQLIVDRLLEKEPKARFPSMAEVEKALANPNPFLKSQNAVTATSETRRSLSLKPIFAVISAITLIAGVGYFVFSKLSDTRIEPMSTSAPLPESALSKVNMSAAHNIERNRTAKFDFEKGYTSISDDALKGFLNRKNVTSINLHGCRLISDVGIKYLQNLKLEELDLSGTGATDGCIASLKGMPLRWLNLHGAAITDKALSDIPKGDLRALDVGETEVSDGGLKALADAPLMSLTLSGCRGITDKALSNIPLQHLQNLGLSRTDVTGEDFSALENAHELGGLLFEGSTVRHEGMTVLGHLKSLKILGFNEARVYPADFKQLASLRLEQIYLENLPLNDGDVKVFLRMPLKGAELSGTKISNASLVELAKIESLKFLRVNRCYGITAAGAENFRLERPDVEFRCDKK